MFHDARRRPYQVRPATFFSEAHLVVQFSKPPEQRMCKLKFCRISFSFFQVKLRLAIFRDIRCLVLHYAALAFSSICAEGFRQTWAIIPLSLFLDFRFVGRHMYELMLKLVPEWLRAYTEI